MKARDVTQWQKVSLATMNPHVQFLLAIQKYINKQAPSFLLPSKKT